MRTYTRFFETDKFVSCNVQEYLTTATLPELRVSRLAPPMPLPSCKSHRNTLNVRVERYRRLQQVHRLKRSRLDKQVNEFIRTHIPSEPIDAEDEDPETGLCPTVPCEGYCINFSVPPQLRHIDELGILWINGLVLQTAECVLKMLPEYRDVARDYYFSRPDFNDDNDSGLFRYFLWEEAMQEGGELEDGSGESSVKLIVAYQPPWILSPRDFDQIAGFNKIPMYNSELENAQAPYKSAHRVWGKLADICERNQCYRFVLTNYNQWAFGGFSSGRSFGFISGIKQAHSLKGKEPMKPIFSFSHSSSRAPNVLEYLVYWMISSMDFPDSYKLPSVPELINPETDINQSVSDSTSMPRTPPQEDMDITAPAIEPSESNWSLANDSVIPASAHVRIDDDSNSTITVPAELNKNWEGVKNPPSYASPTALRDESAVQSWLTRSLDPEVPEQIEGYDHDRRSSRGSSPVASEWSDKSLVARQQKMHAKPAWSSDFMEYEAKLDTIYEFDDCGEVDTGYDSRVVYYTFDRVDEGNHHDPEPGLEEEHPGEGFGLGVTFG
ncbi:hypothetical protein PNOK_0077600 [Pyrrhoderma noxium]|uniref:Uncharacterized protein n=1 Tax=Pyrrhoderma noxium TaxID=2282107 RepID=A0A286UVW2_9AGAM|nr:hypothetical protein PNOK_0077600 [Pyrrhoderma noxium]